MTRRWNHNLHYHPLLLGAVPPGTRAVLDIGCGEGALARDLRARARRVVGIDRHEPSLRLARSADAAGIEYVLGDFLAYPFPPASFDAVLSVATLHHVDATAGLARMRELVRPGGVVGIVGLARHATVVDRARGVAALAASGFLRLSKGYWEQPSPQVWPPPETWDSMRCIAARELPGSSFRRHLLWRYSLIWRRPDAG